MKVMPVVHRSNVTKEFAKFSRSLGMQVVVRYWGHILEAQILRALHTPGKEFTQAEIVRAYSCPTVAELYMTQQERDVMMSYRQSVFEGATVIEMKPLPTVTSNKKAIKYYGKFAEVVRLKDLDYARVQAKATLTQAEIVRAATYKNMALTYLPEMAIIDALAAIHGIYPQIDDNTAYVGK